jgi:hypothetical protein
MNDNRMAIIKEGHKAQRLSDRAINYLAKGKRFHTKFMIYIGKNEPPGVEAKLLL